MSLFWVIFAVALLVILAAPALAYDVLFAAAFAGVILLLYMALRGRL